MTQPAPVIYWFRQDLRLQDLPALQTAVATGRPLVTCYIIDDKSPGEWAPGGASRWWLHHSLESLGRDLEQRGGRLLVRRGDPATELAALAEETGASDVYCSEAYEPWARALESRVDTSLGAVHVQLHCLAGSLLYDPRTLRNGSGMPFKVFTPFWRHCLRHPVATPDTTSLAPDAFAAINAESLSAREWQLLPQSPNWAEGWQHYWSPGEAGARASLAQFLHRGLKGYGEARDFPAINACSRLSAHIHWGELSPRQALADVAMSASIDDTDRQKFTAQIGWREFNHHLLFHFPHIEDRPFKPGFENMPWQGRDDHFTAWKLGQTGYPIVDAGMRELWQTGYMHNRVRMVCASFLTKHLLIPWQWGARWFWDTLVDADLANNSGGWQWVAGSGADASPYFRVFNPVLQGQKFDAKGDYVRRWVPELAQLTGKLLHSPWEATPAQLEAASVALDQTYPLPIVDHKTARRAALDAYEAVSASSSA
jgi:deoxyribodipyrimidine photo-lyase